MANLFHRLVHREDRYVALLVSLVLLLASYPVVQELNVRHLYGIILAAQLILSVYSIGETRVHLWTGVCLCLPAFGLQLISAIHLTRLTMLMADTAALVFLGYVIVVVYRAILKDASFDENNIAGAVSVYLLIGVFWSVVYNVIAILQPDSFSDYKVLEIGGTFHYAGGADFLYFSFVTLTTLGYGDISPDTTLAQTAAWGEAVVGQLFVAVTIASLVSVRVAQAVEEGRRKRRADENDGDNNG